MDKRTHLFIDVDGVLFGYYDGRVQLRPGVWSFLDWCTRRFQCIWLTAWPEQALLHLARWTMGGNVASKITYCNWVRCGDKAAAVLEAGRQMPGDWLWIEDGLPGNEMDALQQAGCDSRYIPVNNQGRDELERVRGLLERFVLEEADHDPA